MPQFSIRSLFSLTVGSCLLFAFCNLIGMERSIALTVIALFTTPAFAFVGACWQADYTKQQRVGIALSISLVAILSLIVVLLLTNSAKAIPLALIGVGVVWTGQWLGLAALYSTWKSGIEAAQEAEASLRRSSESPKRATSVSKRQHNRGPHPADVELFQESNWPKLQEATQHLRWLLSHGYAAPSSLKLVGDRFDLVARQRTGVMRATCSDQSRADRLYRRKDASELAQQDIEIDALNLLITVEAALAGGLLLACCDETYRDMASIHGSYRKVQQTQQAIELVGRMLEELGVAHVLWRIDRPVSNSGRLKMLLLEHAKESGYHWQVSLDDDPDRVLGDQFSIVVSADSAVIDRVAVWSNLAKEIVDRYVPEATIVPMQTPSTGK